MTPTTATLLASLRATSDADRATWLAAAPVTAVLLALVCVVAIVVNVVRGGRWVP